MENENDAGVENLEDEGSVTPEGVEAGASVSSAEEKGEPDWKTIAHNYKTALDQKRQLRKDGVTTPPEGEAVQVTREDIRDLIKEVVEPLVTTSAEDRLLTTKVTDPAKREYVKQLLQSRIVRTGTSEQDIESDIETALAIADSHKKDKTISELRRVAENRPPAPSAGSSNERPAEQKAHKWTAEQARALDAKADALGVDREKFKSDAWANIPRTRVL